MKKNNKINFEKKEGDRYFRRNLLKDKMPHKTARPKLLVEWLKPFKKEHYERL